MNGILIDNALESWKSAIVYANDIVAGKSTLKYRKNFVSSLHNATELFIKQLMLDTGNHEVCKRVAKKEDPDGSLQIAMNAVTDLNDFFANLSQDNVKKYRSQSYNFICKKSLSLFDTYYSTHPHDQSIVSDALETLRDLRNNETHFFIDKWTFLTESEFQKLYNFMIVFYRILKEYGLLPFWGEPSKEYEDLDFNKSPLTSFSYKEALIRSNVLMKIAEVSDQLQMSWEAESAFEIAKAIVEHDDNAHWGERFDELWAYVETAMHYDLITINNVVVEYDEPEGGKNTNIYYYICINDQ